MSPHTPGPWTLAEDDPYKIVNSHPYGGVIADASYWWTDKPTARANARLIAAAPALLEALERIVDIYAWDGRGPEVEQAHVVIAAAKGGKI